MCEVFKRLFLFTVSSGMFPNVHGYLAARHSLVVQGEGEKPMTCLVDFIAYAGFIN